jgi:hypothetical protein
MTSVNLGVMLSLPGYENCLVQFAPLTGQPAPDASLYAPGAWRFLSPTNSTRSTAEEASFGFEKMSAVRSGPTAQRLGGGSLVGSIVRLSACWTHEATPVGVVLSPTPQGSA